MLSCCGVFFHCNLGWQWIVYFVNYCIYVVLYSFYIVMSCIKLIGVLVLTTIFATSISFILFLTESALFWINKFLLWLQSYITCICPSVYMRDRVSRCIYLCLKIWYMYLCEHICMYDCVYYAWKSVWLFTLYA